MKTLTPAEERRFDQQLRELERVLRARAARQRADRQLGEAVKRLTPR